MNLLTIGGSNSKKSINKALAFYVAQQFQQASITAVDISAMDIPLYSIDLEMEKGIPDEILDFAAKIDQADLIILSLAEHNGSFSVGFKNVLDWTSRIKDRKTFNGKNLFLLSTSPGARGGASVLETAKQLYPYAGATIVASFSLPEFYKNFDLEKGLTNPSYQEQLQQIISTLY